MSDVARSKQWETRIARKRETKLPALMERVTAACEARLQAGEKITYHAIGKDLGLHANWTHFKWQYPAVERVDDYIAQQRPKDIDPAAVQHMADQGFFFDNSRGRNWAKPLPEPPLLKRCYFTGERAPTWQILLFRKARGWEHWCYASDKAVERLREKQILDSGLRLVS